MILDPSNPNMAMDHHGRLFVAKTHKPGPDGKPQVDEWMMTEEINLKGEFRRPEW